MKRKQYFMAVLLASILCLEITVYAGLFDQVNACGDAYLGGLSDCGAFCELLPTEVERSACRSQRSHCINSVGLGYSYCLSGLGWEEAQMDKCGAAEHAKYMCISGYSVCGGFEVEGCLSEYMSCLATSGIYDCE